MAKYKYGVHIFRRDYRIYDNTSLVKLSKIVEHIIPIFIFTPTQIDHNTYKSNNCVQFLVESLIDLNGHIAGFGSRLAIFYGDDDKIIGRLLVRDDIGAVSFNHDYTKYSQTRDTKLRELITGLGREVIQEHDILLHPLGTIKTGSGTTYTKFTPFMTACLAVDIPKPDRTRVLNFASKSQLNTVLQAGPKEYTGNLNKMYGGVDNPDLPEKGGRMAGLKILASMKNKKTWADYNEKRDQLAYRTTHLSPYNKFGCLSIREIYWTMRIVHGPKIELIKQLVWRDFYYNLSATHPWIYEHKPMNLKWLSIPWKNDATLWKAWKLGRTGFPIVDACMAEINKTGYMHNRGRLIVSNFLVRLLHIDWLWGEKYFAEHLYDYDPAQNSFGWQINAAVSGTEARPLSQTILNPWIQSAKYDHNAVYIKKWLPVLDTVPALDLHRWNETHVKYQGIGYPEPIIDYATEKVKNLKLYA